MILEDEKVMDKWCQKLVANTMNMLRTKEFGHNQPGFSIKFLEKIENDLNGRIAKIVNSKKMTYKRDSQLGRV